MLPCSEQREQILRELVQELMHQELPKLELVLQLAEPELQELYQVNEQLVVIALEFELGLQNLLEYSVAQLEPLPPEDCFQFGQEPLPRQDYYGLRQ
jgi:hypothetical protein